MNYEKKGSVENRRRLCDTKHSSTHPGGHIPVSPITKNRFVHHQTKNVLCETVGEASNTRRLRLLHTSEQSTYHFIITERLLNVTKETARTRRIHTSSICRSEPASGENRSTVCT